MGSLMKSIAVKNGSGPAEAMFVNMIPKPQASKGQAVVRVKAFGLNRMDLAQREGKYPVPRQAPVTMGVEFSGIIETVDSTHGSFKPGDEVFGLAYGGAYAEFVSVSTKTLIQKPAEISWEEAAGIPEAWITAIQASFKIGGFEPGQSVLWHAGSSAVSIAGVQFCRAYGAKEVYVTAGSQEKIDFCVNELGATAGFNYRTSDWAKEILDRTGGEGVNLIIDYIGANYFGPNLSAVSRDGQIVILGLLSGGQLPNGVDITPILRKRVKLEGSSLRSRDEDYQKSLRDLLIDTALEKLRDGTFTVYVERVFEFDQIIDAHKLLESNKTKGKVICTINS